jgi:hypothetical protein
MAFNTKKGVVASLSVKTISSILLVDYNVPFKDLPRGKKAKIDGGTRFQPVAGRQPSVLPRSNPRSYSVQESPCDSEVFLGQTRGLTRSKSGLATPRSSSVKPEVYLGPRVKQILFSKYKVKTLMYGKLKATLVVVCKLKTGATRCRIVSNWQKLIPLTCCKLLTDVMLQQHPSFGLKRGRFSKVHWQYRQKNRALAATHLPLAHYAAPVEVS